MLRSLCGHHAACGEWHRAPCRGRGSCHVRAESRSYSARRDLRLSVSNPGNDELQSYTRACATRVVRLAFPPERQRRLSEHAYRVTMLPIDFLWLRLRCVCNLLCEPVDDGSLVVSGRDIVITGLPGELDPFVKSISIKMDGSLYASAPNVLSGSVSLRLAASVIPDVLLLAPGLDQAVQSILDASLFGLETRLREELRGDHANWLREREAARLMHRQAAGAGGKPVG